MGRVPRISPEYDLVRDDPRFQARATMNEQLARIEAKVDRKVDVPIKTVRDDIRHLAEGLTAMGERMDRRFDEGLRQAAADRRMFLGILGNHEERISTLERRDTPQ